jgi:hypothetical protein
MFPQYGTYLNHLIEPLFFLEATKRSFDPEETNLLFLLFTHRAAAATDPRDKISAILSLRDNIGDEKIHLNYYLKPGALYTEIASLVPRNFETLDLLNIPKGEAPSSITGLPSWVADWTTPSPCQHGY